MKMIKTGGLHQIESGAIDEYLLAYFNPITNEFNLPKPRNDRYKQGKPGILALYIDDCICTKLMSNRKFFNLVTRHRWLGQFPEGGAVGLSLMIATMVHVIFRKVRFLCLSENKLNKLKSKPK